MIEPWQLTREQWNAERQRLRPEVAQCNFTKASASQDIARHERLTWLLFDVHAETSARLKAAAAGECHMTREEAQACLDELARPVTYDDVLARAKRLGLMTEAA